MNSCFFHTSVTTRKRRNFVGTIFYGNIWLKTFSQIHNFFLEKFEDLYSSSNPPVQEFGLGSIVIYELENREILRTPSEDEIRRCIWDMYPLKAPGPDGFQRAFYRDHWTVIKGQVVKAIQGSFSNRSVTPGFNRMFIVLIPKVRQLVNFSNFRPISLCNFCYKIISKILINLLKRLLDRFTSSNQRAFVEGR